MNRVLIIISLILLASFNLYAEETDNATSQHETDTSYIGDFLTSEKFGQPLLSEIHSTIFRIEQNIGLSLPEYDISFSSKKMHRAYVTADFGKNIPLYSYDTAKWGVSITAPVSLHTWVDMYEDTTAPVLNTDYRLGVLRTTFIYRFNETNKFFKNIAFQVTPLLHECTHIGDELALFRRLENLPLTRVNISYEMADFNIMLNDPDGRYDNRHSFKLGMSVRLTDRGEGYFSIREDQECGAENCVATEFDKSSRRFEWYANYQYQKTKGILVNEQFMFMASVEARLRVKYAYPIYIQNGTGTENVSWNKVVLQETYSPGFNGFIGYKFTPTRKSAPPVGLFIHAYAGINPYGQFRSIPFYYSLGLSLTLF